MLTAPMFWRTSTNSPTTLSPAVMWWPMTMFGTFREIAPPGLLVYTEAFVEFPDGGEAVVTMTVEERDGKTHWRSSSVYGSKETRDAVVASGMEEGARETVDALEALLRRLQA